MTTAIDYSIKARALVHVDIALAALAHDPIQVPKAINHLNQTRALIAQFPDVTDGGGFGGISPVMLIAGAVGLYFLMSKR